MSTTAAFSLCSRHPAEPSLEGMKACQRCVDYAQQAYKEAKKQGKCVSNGHHDREAVDGCVVCSDCLIQRRLNRLREKGLPPSEIAKAKRALEEFDGHCSCCDTLNHGSKNWHLDHDDVLKVFRGILCVGCNSIIGYAHEDVHQLQKVAKYIAKWKPCS